MPTFRRLFALIALGLLIAACTPAAAPDADAGGDAAQTESQAPGADANAGDRTEIRWFVGLGTGHQEELQPTQLEIVEQFNESQDEITLRVEFIETESAVDILNTQIAAGNAPDIVGPVGIGGRGQFDGNWLDLSDLLDGSDYDLSDFDPALVDFYNLPDQGQIGLPFAIFPSFLYFNKELFDEAGLNYPPQEYDEPYVMPNGEEVEWNLDAVRDIGQLLTVDASGNDATSPDFYPDNVVQFGFDQQFSDMRARATLWGAGSLMDEEGNAQIPDPWRDAFAWIHTAIFEDQFYPSGAYEESTLLNEGDAFSSGNVAMVPMHLWYASCCLQEMDFQWGIGATPIANGQITSKIHADTFSIIDSTDHPQEAFEVLTYLLSPDVAATLTRLYGGQPARGSLQEDYFASLDSQFPDQEVNWPLAAESLQYPDNPSHEEGLPNLVQVQDLYGQFQQRLINEPDFDIEAGLESLQQDLQTIFDQAN